jgi:hypothetical protein
MKTKYILPVLLAFVFVSFKKANAQSAEEKLAKTILQKDSLFWQSYNNCDTTNYNQFFADDVEFYHDKGGITLGVENMALSVKKNLCGNPDFRIRREAVNGTVKVFPLEKSGEIYGAILSGEHVFYIVEKGKPPRLDGKASFTHLWILKDNAWKMTRILSYDHGPAQ